MVWAHDVGEHFDGARGRRKRRPAAAASVPASSPRVVVDDEHRRTRPGAPGHSWRSARRWQARRARDVKSAGGQRAVVAQPVAQIERLHELRPEDGADEAFSEVLGGRPARLPW